MTGVGHSSRFLKNMVLSHPDHDRAIKAMSRVLERVEAALQLRSDDAASTSAPRVVTFVPPNFSLTMIVDCYQAGLRHFGETTPHELIRKAEAEDILQHCPDIKWHFYGPLQPSVATSRLVKAPNLYMIESVHNDTLATVLDQSAASVKRESLLKVMVQVAASEKEEKLGLLAPSSSYRLCQHIVEDCPYLELCGLMVNTSSSGNASTNNDSESNETFDEEFQALATARLDVCRTLQMEVEELQLSVGGSWDFERAIELGSSNVRIDLEALGVSAPEYSPVVSVAEDVSLNDEENSK